MRALASNLSVKILVLYCVGAICMQTVFMVDVASLRPLGYIEVKLSALFLLSAVLA